MDWVTQVMIGGFILLILATLWNTFFGPKKAMSLFSQFVEKYGFTVNRAATLCTGVFANRNIQISKDPLTITFQVTNPKGVHLLVEKGIQSSIPDLVDVPIKEVKVKSNFPQLAVEIIDKEVLSMVSDKEFSFFLEEGLQLRCSEEVVEDMMKVGVKIAAKLEAITYASNSVKRASS